MCDDDFDADVHCEAVLYGISNMAYVQRDCADFGTLVRGHIQRMQDGDFLRVCLSEDPEDARFWEIGVKCAGALLADPEKSQALTAYGLACWYGTVPDEVYDAAWRAVQDALLVSWA